MLAKYAIAVVQDGITPYGKCKTSDFLRQNIRTFASKVRHFYAKKSDVFNFRNRRHRSSSSSRGALSSRCGFGECLQIAIWKG